MSEKKINLARSTKDHPTYLQLNSSPDTSEKVKGTFPLTDQNGLLGKKKGKK